jgi:hypothetical protein
MITYRHYLNNNVTFLKSTYFKVHQQQKPSLLLRLIFQYIRHVQQLEDIQTHRNILLI